MKGSIRNLSGLFLIALVFIVFSAPGISEEKAAAEEVKPAGLGNPVVHKLTENVYAITGLYHSAGKGFTTNAGIIFTRRSVIFLDAGMTIASGEFLWNTAKERMKGKDKIYLILTHHHSDHIFGMRVMKEKGARVIAHQFAAEFLEYYKDKYKDLVISMSGWDAQKGNEILGEVVLSLPDETIEQDTALRLDGEDIYLLYTPGHVSSEISVYHPRSKTLFAGDTIYQGYDLTTKFGGPEEWKRWISQLERLKELDIKVIVPGHGQLCGQEEIDRNITFLKKKLEIN